MQNPFFCKRYGDIYFQPYDPEGEKYHVFIQGNRLPQRLAHGGTLTIAELGFGFGLNCALAITLAEKTGAKLFYHAVEECYPEPEQIIALAAKLRTARDAYEKLWQHGSDLKAGKKIQIGGTSLQVFCGGVHDFLAQADFVADAWFFDGFSPAKNPTMWSADIFRAAWRLTRPGGSFATYSSAGWVRRNLLAAGFTCHKVVGFAGKREMLVGEK